VRIACGAVAVNGLERVLAQGEPSPTALKDMQALLEKEDEYPFLLVAARGERAGSDRCLACMESGNSHPSGSALATVGIGPSDPAQILVYFPGEIKREHAALLSYMNRVVEAAKLPEPLRKPEYDRLEAGTRQAPPLVRLLVPAMSRIAGADQRAHALLRGAIVMVAAERYRQKEGRWPETVQALADGGYLKAVPLDPYDGAPIRLKHVKDGLVIYALGPDGKDDGGNIDRKNPVAKGTDLGFRMWDVDKRRQPPLPPRAKEQPADGGGP
jgi:hypothetical protein